MFTREQIKAFMEDYEISRKVVYTLPIINSVTKFSERELNKVVKKFGCRREDIVGIAGDVVLTLDALYSKEFARYPKISSGEMKLSLEGITQIESIGLDYTMKRRGSDYHFEKVYFENGLQIIYAEEHERGFVTSVLDFAKKTEEQERARQRSTNHLVNHAIEKTLAVMRTEALEILKNTASLRSKETVADLENLEQNPQIKNPIEDRKWSEKEITALWMAAGCAACEVERYSEALEYFKRIAEQGKSEAQYICGIFYENGKGVDADQENALLWYEKAAEQGHMDAQYSCAQKYYSGAGVRKDLGRAFLWFEKAAEQKHKEAQYYCGFMYENGLGTKKDLSKAFCCYSDAENQGHIEATYRCAELAYEKGDKWMSSALYEKAAEKGHAGAQFKIGRMYYYGAGGYANYDREKASEWMHKASAQGHLEAHKFLNSHPF